MGVTRPACLLEVQHQISLSDGVSGSPTHSCSEAALSARGLGALGNGYQQIELRGQGFLPPRSVCDIILILYIYMCVYY